MPAGSCFYRVFNPTRYGTRQLTFRRNGPWLRFDHHPGEGRKREAVDHPTRGIFYGAPTLSCCIVEVFGDSRLIEPEDLKDYRVAFIEVTRDLSLVDLVDEAMTAGTIAAISGITSYKKSQAWSRMVYEKAGFEHIDGIYYRAAHNGQTSYALYERAKSGLHCPAMNVLELGDPGMRIGLLDIANRYGIRVVSP